MLSASQGISFTATAPLFVTVAVSQPSIWRYDRFDAVARLPLSFEDTTDRYLNEEFKRLVQAILSVRALERTDAS